MSWRQHGQAIDRICGTGGELWERRLDGRREGRHSSVEDRVRDRRSGRVPRRHRHHLEEASVRGVRRSRGRAGQPRSGGWRRCSARTLRVRRTASQWCARTARSTLRRPSLNAVDCAGPDQDPGEAGRCRRPTSSAGAGRGWQSRWLLAAALKSALGVSAAVEDLHGPTSRRAVTSTDLRQARRRRVGATVDAFVGARPGRRACADPR